MDCCRQQTYPRVTCDPELAVEIRSVDACLECMGMRLIDMVEGNDVLSLRGEEGIAGVFSPVELSLPKLASMSVCVLVDVERLSGCCVPERRFPFFFVS